MSAAPRVNDNTIHEMSYLSDLYCVTVKQLYLNHLCNIQAAVLAGKSKREREKLCQGFEIAVEKVKSTIESDRIQKSAKWKVCK